MKSSFLSALAITIAFAGSVSAQTPAKPALTKPVLQIEPGAYAIDSYHTQVTFAVSHLGFTEFRGRLGDVSGTLQLDPGNPANSTFDVTVPTASVNTPVDKLTDELKGEQWLDAKVNPEIIFKAKSVTVTGPQTAKVTGDLTLHGVTKSLTLDAKLNRGGVNPLDKKFTVGFELAGKIKRSDFGVKTYLPLIGDEVDLTISAAFEKQG
jgi:polyisoprenoid-binding protein YceI